MPNGSTGFNESPVVLPSFFGQPGDAMQLAIGNQQRQQQFDYMREKQEQSDLWKRIGLVQDETNPERIATGDITADEWLGNEAKSSMQRILSNPSFATMQPNDLYGLIQREWLPTIDAFKAIKSGISNIDQEAKMAGTENKNIASDKVAVEAKRRLINTILPTDEKGERKFNRNISAMPQKSYVQEILSSPERYKYVQSGQPLIDFISKTKLSEISPHKQLADKTVIPYKGKQSPFVKLNVTPSEIGRLNVSDNPKYEILTEEDYITDDSGNKVKVRLLDEGIYRSIESIPELNDALDLMWNNYKEENKIVPKNNAHDEKMKRAYAVGVFETYDPSEITAMTPQHLPRQSSYTSIRMGGGSGDSGLNVNDIYSRIDKKINTDIEKGFTATRFNSLSNDEQEVVKKAVEVAGEEVGESGSNVFLNKDSKGNIKIYRVAENGEMLLKPEYEITTLSYTGANIPKQPGVKEKREVIERAKGDVKTVEKGVINISDIPAGTKLEQKNGKYYYKGKEVKL